MAEYLASIEVQPDGPIHQCYAALCNITHPAADTVLYLLEKDHTGAILFRDRPDEDAITELCEGGRTVAAYALSESLILPAMILRVLNHYGLPAFHTQAIDTLGFSEIPTWKEIEPMLKANPH